MKRIVLGVSGSVAAYRAADLARELMRSGFKVRVCLTDSAEKFVTRALFEALTGEPCLQDAFEEPSPGRMAHIDWAREADVLVIAPATASTISRLAGGVGDDMLTTLALAYMGPLVIAPAMNPSMYANEAVQDSIQALSERGAVVVEPDEGDVACGEHGQGKLASISRIVGEVLAVSRRSELLSGKKVLITSGPTQEPIDDVRFLSNRSSGKMGASLARAALLLGAQVTVVSGPSAVPLPMAASVIRVRSAAEMLEAVMSRAPEMDMIIGAAAVADYRPVAKVRGKMRRGEAPTSIDLVENPDVIAEAARAANPGAIVVGFAAEPSAETETARQKILRKGLAAIAVNDVSRSDIGFESSENDLTLILATGVVEHSGKMSKLACSLWLIDKVAKLAPARVEKLSEA